MLNISWQIRPRLDLSSIRRGAISSSLTRLRGIEGRPFASGIITAAAVGVLAFTASTLINTGTVRSRQPITYNEIREHSTPESAWVVYNGQVYDITGMIRTHGAHPGDTSNSLLSHAGQDISGHPKPLELANIRPIGRVDRKTMPKPVIKSITRRDMDLDYFYMLESCVICD